MKTKLILTTLMLLTTLSFSQMVNKKLGAQEFKGSITLKAKASAVWAVISDSKKIFPLLGYEYKGGALSLSQAGDNVSLKLWEDVGTLVVSKVTKEKELRLMWDPNNASYICQDRFVLKESAGKTTLTYVNTYTESGPQKKSDLEAQTKGLNEFLAKLKKELEK